MSDSNNGFKTFMSFITGAAIGAIFGVLFAPKSGKEMREELREFAEKLAEEAKKEYGEASSKAKDLGSRAKRLADEARGRGHKGGEDPDQAS
ncbi:MAG: hypothetical protein A2W19_12180 [Spirochaetes bacterium RBG_16_49_21]|nr:MAG: hypothetical protein A2W19_12180 [Spirochaetes bacterium RBG_16_49_21]